MNKYPGIHKVVIRTVGISTYVERSPEHVEYVIAHEDAKTGWEMSWASFTGGMEAFEPDNAYIVKANALALYESNPEWFPVDEWECIFIGEEPDEEFQEVARYLEEDYPVLSGDKLAGVEQEILEEAIDNYLSDDICTALIRICRSRSSKEENIIELWEEEGDEWLREALLDMHEDFTFVGLSAEYSNKTVEKLAIAFWDRMQELGRI